MPWIQAEFNYIKLGLARANIYTLHSVHGRTDRLDLGRIKEYILPKQHSKLETITSEGTMWAAWNPHCVGEYARMGPFEVAQGKVQELYRLVSVIIDSHPNQPGGWTWRLNSMKDHQDVSNRSVPGNDQASEATPK